MRYLVTGDAGFIATHLVERLLTEGHAVIGIDKHQRPPMGDDHVPVQANICDWADLHRLWSGPGEHLPIDGCFHLAAESGIAKPWRDTILSNILGTCHVGQWCAEYDVPLVFTSSGATYSSATTRTHGQLLSGQHWSMYGASKLLGEQMLAAPAMAVRLSNVYGPGGKKAVLGSWMQILAGGGGRLPIHGDGKQSRDFVYVDDVVDGLVAAMAHVMACSADQWPRALPPIDICTGAQTTICSLLGMLEDILHRDLEPEYTGEASGATTPQTSPGAARATMGWSAKTDLATGLIKTLKHWGIS